jgi:GT2 family glycosyltransferase
MSPTATTRSPISIVVCTHERPDDLERCLAALLPIAAAGHEVLVVDNAPRSARTAQVAARFPFRYLQEERQGLDNARNRGLREASYAIVAYTDDDAVPEASWADAIALPFADPAVGCVTGLVLPLELETSAQRRFETYCAHRRVFATQTFAAPETPPATAGVAGMGANMALRRELALGLGGFDPRLDGGTATCSGGDTDIFARVLDSGARIVYTPEARVLHRHRRGEDELRRCIFGYGVGLTAFLTKRVVEQGDLYALVVAARWMAGPPLKAAWKRLRGKQAVPPDLLLAEAAGALLGPLRFWRARAAA